MHVVIAGCGRVGSQLAQWLADAGHDVAVIDRRRQALDTLGKSFNGAVVEGLAYDVDVLREAGIESTDVFVAVTDSDNANLMAVEVARHVFGVTRTLARLYDPAREHAYRALDVKHVTGTKLIANVIFEQILAEEFQYHVTFEEGDVEIVEFVLSPEIAGLTVRDLQVRDRLRVAAVRRADHTFIPGDDFELKPGDLVVAAAREGTRGRIRKYIREENAS